MATMVKEKCREKKKYKEKEKKSVLLSESSLVNNHLQIIAEHKNPLVIGESSTMSIITTESQTLTDDHIINKTSCKVPEVSLDAQNVYLNCIDDLEKAEPADVSLGSEANELIKYSPVSQSSLEIAVPSAPILEDHLPNIVHSIDIPVINEVLRLKSMPLEEAVRLFAGTVIAEVNSMSEIEQAIVEAGLTNAPEHPLVDLLSTFRRSLIAVEYEQTQLQVGYAESEKFMWALWKINKRTVQAVEKCPCGLHVNFKATYEHAELQIDKLPSARLRLEKLLKDVQESYCHHQYEALLAHYQIEEFLWEVIQKPKCEIREALVLMLQALKRCDDTPFVLESALERWTQALANALVDQRDLRHLLFLVHHLFRQNRSVRWAASIVTVNVTDSVSAARAIALLDLLFARTWFDSAIECVEDNVDTWEEVGKDGCGGAVSDGSLRERDLLSLLRAMPIRDLVATLLRMHTVVGQPRSYRWQDADCLGVIRACCGARTLLYTLSRAVTAHPSYSRLQSALRQIARNMLHALAALHEHARSSYSAELEQKVFGELQAVFLSGLEILSNEMHVVPASLLVSHAAREYCDGHILAVENHDENFPYRVQSLSLDLPHASCDVRVRVVAHAAIRRRRDYELARLALDFLFQLGVRRIKASVTCKGMCRQAARKCIAGLLSAHPHLHAFALHLVGETYPVEKLEPSSIECLSIANWRPQCGEVRVVLDAWAQRCPALLPALLSQLNCTPHSGVSLDSQLTIGSWLCDYVSARNGECEEWCWYVLRRLRLHRLYWSMPLETPPPDVRPVHLFHQAYALAATCWGHSIPMICSEGVEALHALASTRTQDALHFLSPIMLVLAHSPESVSTTPRFADVFTLLINAGPGLVQRALGRGGAPGADCLLRLMMQQLKEERCGGVSRSEVASGWIAALWGAGGGIGGGLLDAALLAVPRTCLRQHLTTLARAQDEESKKQLIAATKWYAHAPLLCESALYVLHTEWELRTSIFPRLLDALHAQRVANQRIHVDNALKSLGVTFGSDQLTIYGVAAASLASPISHPSSLYLWHLFMHLYLQRPPSTHVDATPPVGPLFFNGLIKSRTLAQLKRRLLKFIQHHAAEAAILKAKRNKDLYKSHAQPVVSSGRSRNETVVDSMLTTPLTIDDLTGESNESSDSDSFEEQKEDSDSDECVSDGSDVTLLLAYHVGAERMFCEYIRWLDEGEKTKAMPHDAEIGRFILEQVSLHAAFVQESRNRTTSLSPDLEPPPLPPAVVPPPTPCPNSPLDDATQALLNIKNSSRNRLRRRPIRSLLEYVNIKDSRSMLAWFDKHLNHMQTLSREWCKEVATVASLDAELWDFVRDLRVPHQIPTLYASCPNKCKPITYTPTEKQWCISSGALQGIEVNRETARTAVRRLARSRPDAARSAAALFALARRSGSFEMARKMVAKSLQVSRSVSEQCAPATAALAALVDLLAERWLLNSGSDCAELLTQWSGAKDERSVQQLLCMSLVSPSRCGPEHVPALHAAVLNHFTTTQAFSALSKFDLGKWAQFVDSNKRLAMLDSLMSAAQRWGPTPDPEHLLLVELLGVQMAALCHATELCSLACASARACVKNTFPTAVLQHVVHAAEKCAPDVPFDQLGHLLREIGVIWWERRTKANPSDVERYEAYAHDTIRLLLTLHSAFVDAAVNLSYAREKVAMVSWSSLQESFAAWLLPDAPPSFPPALLHRLQFENILESVKCALKQLMYRHPGIEAVLLNQVFEWVLKTYQMVRASSKGRIELLSLLVCFSDLPWTSHQWLQPTGLQVLLQVSQSGDEEVLSWCSRCCGRLEENTWIRAAGEGGLPSLLYLWTGTTYPATERMLQVACGLSWGRLPVVALEDALERFFQLNYGLTTPYHDLPQFKVILAAGEMTLVSGNVATNDPSRQKRAQLVSQWGRAAIAPALLSHVPEHVSALAACLHAIAPHLVRVGAKGEEELVDLLGRALNITCIEPAAAAALPVLERFVSSSDPCMMRAILRAVSGLTAFSYFAPLADVAVRTHLAQDGDWHSVKRAWQNCVWNDPGPLCARARLYAAYAMHAFNTDNTIRTSLLALIAADMDFKKSEAIIAVWICVACRVARCSDTGGAGAGAAAESRAAAFGLLSRWSEAPRGLLRLVLPSAATTSPTPAHRILCLLAQCILSPDNTNVVRAYESACAAVSSSNPDVVDWGRNPYPKRLPRLAMRLFPTEDKYFIQELDLAPDDT